MSKSKFIIALICVSTLSVAAAMAQACSFPPDELVENSNAKRDYKGVYTNDAYGYSVVIPEHHVGYASVDPLYQHGFGIILEPRPRGYLLVNGEANSLEYVSSAIAAKESLKFLRRHAAKVESTKIRQTRLGKLPAAFVLATYTCSGSTERFVKASSLALSPDKRTVYEVTLYAAANRYRDNRALFNQLLRTWRYTGAR